MAPSRRVSLASAAGSMAARVTGNVHFNTAPRRPFANETYAGSDHPSPPRPPVRDQQVALHRPATENGDGSTASSGSGHTIFSAPSTSSASPQGPSVRD